MPPKPSVNPDPNLLHGISQVSVNLNYRNLMLVMGVVLQRRLNGWGKEGHRKQDPGCRWDNEVHGAFGECALADYLKVWWDGGTAAVYTEADVGDLQVKGTPVHGGRLLLHEDTPDKEVFILATCKNIPWIELRGWMYGHEAKNKPLYWDEPQKGRGCYCVPQSALHPMNTLPTGKK